MLITMMSRRRMRMAAMILNVIKKKKQSRLKLNEPQHKSV